MHTMDLALQGFEAVMGQMTALLSLVTRPEYTLRNFAVVLDSCILSKSSHGLLKSSLDDTL